METREGQFGAGDPEGAGLGTPEVAAVKKENTSEKDRRAKLIRRYIDQRVIALDPDFEEEDLSENFADLSAREKVDLLYNKLVARYKALEAIRQEEASNPESKPEPIDPYLISEIKTLWSDQEVADLFVSRYAEARIDAKLYRLSELGSRWQRVNQTITRKEREFEALTQKLFLRQVARPDQLAATRGKAERLAKDLIRLREEREQITKLYDLPPIPENADTAAAIQYDKLREYKRQAGEGFVWLDSRTQIHHQTIAALQNGRWPVLVGEAGSGKSEQADAAARVLTGEDPTHLACGERTSERDMISDKEIDPVTGGSFDAYGPVMQAATGYDDSRQSAPSHHGRIVRFDESGRLGSQGYAIIKELRQKRPGDLLFGKPVQSGFGSIWTTNPVGPRYPDRTDPDPAMRRELAYIEVDYPPMTEYNPELYEFMLANLMDENDHIAVAGKEVAPAYRKVDYPAQFKMGEYVAGLNSDRRMTPAEIEEINKADPRLVTAYEEVITDRTSSEHGTLWRLSFAIRALQDAFNYGNAQEIPDTALRYVQDQDGTKVVTSGGDPLTLATSTVTLGEIASWMRGFAERKIKDNPEFQTDNLTEWIQFKLETYIKQTDTQDREKIRAIFEYFHLFDPSNVSAEAKPLTPKEIGYLSPRVPRPLILAEPKKEEAPQAVSPERQPRVTTTPELHQAIELMLEDGKMVFVRPQKLVFEKSGKSTSLFPNNQFDLSGEKVRFKGFVDASDPIAEHQGKLVIEIMDEPGLHRLVTEDEIKEQGENFWPFEKLSQEEVERQYNKQIEALRTARIIEQLRSGAEGIIDINGRECPLPTMETVMAQLAEKQEIIAPKIEQGFNKLLLVPFGKSLDQLIQVSKQRILEHKRQNKLLGTDGTALDLDTSEPIWVWDQYPSADRQGKIVYNPTAYTQNNHGGQTKAEILADSSVTPGWQIQLVEDMPDIPRANNGKNISGRAQPEAGKTPNEYLRTQQTEPVYTNEQFFTPESWITYFISHLEETDQVIDDYQGRGSVRYLGAAWFPSASYVPYAYWNRGSRRASLSRYDPTVQSGDCGVGSAVRIS
ncbi:MAG TPA: AAA family ATPase [bacterium]|nr:AAA family ATPase [bacterium]